MSRSSRRSRRSTSNISARSRRSRTRRRKSSSGSSRGARPCSIAKRRNSSGWTAAARSRGASVRTFGADEACDARLIEVVGTEAGSRVETRILGRRLRFDIGAPGAHMAENALGALLAAHELGADVDACASALAGFSAQKGRGARISIPTPDGVGDGHRRKLQRQPGLDARGAEAARRGEARAERPPHRRHRRYARTRPGRRGAARRARRRSRGQPDRSPVRGGTAHAGAVRSGARRRCALHGRSARSELTATIAAALRGGDVVMVKGSNASRMGPLVAALRDHFDRAAQGENVRC